MIERCRLLLVLPALLLACATAGDQQPMKHVTLKTTQPVEVSSASGSVSVSVEDGNTIIRIRGARITCGGHEGYLGSIGTISGSLKVGVLRISYTNENARIQAPDRWMNVRLRESLNLYVGQDGSVGRSIFKDS